MRMMKLQNMVFACLAGFSPLAAAHPAVSGGDDFIHGLQHTLLGLDHLLVMLGLGLWASGQNRRFAAQVLALFGLSMAAGALMGGHGLSFAGLESAVLLSLLLVGLALGLGTAKLSKAAIMPAIAAFAVVHGLDHGQEMPAAVSANLYIAGLLSAAGLLYFGGWALGLSVRQAGLSVLIRVYGTMAGCAGAWLLFTV